MTWGADVPVKKSGGSYLKLNDGESASGVILGEPYTYYVLWDAGNKRTWRLSERPDSEARQRFTANFLCLLSGQVLIWDMSGTTFSHLVKTFQQTGTNELRITVERFGEGFQTRYIVTGKHQLSPEDQAKVEQARQNLYDLATEAHKEVTPDPEPGSQQWGGQAPRQAPPPQQQQQWGQAPPPQYGQQQDYGQHF